MKTARRSVGLTFLCVAFAAAAQGQTAPDKITFDKIKYADLGKFVRGLTGKVVVVNFWAEF